MTANTTITDSISFSASTADRFFNVTGTRTLTFGASGTVIGVSNASPRRYIVTNGTLSQGGVAKVFSGVGSFTYPISGATTKYTPATITVNSGSPAGTITVKPINNPIPFATSGSGGLLQYYWRVEKTGFTTNPNATLSFTYEQTDVTGNETNYVPAVYNPAAFTTYAPTNVDETNNIINFNNINFIAGQYTAGETDRFGPVPALYSVANGDWFSANTWSSTPGGTPGNGGAPNASKPIFILGSRTVTISSNGAQAASVDIASTNDVLQIGDGTSGHDLGELTGFGTLRLISNSATAPTFPTATYTTFLSEDGGTVEFGGTGTYTVPNTPASIGEYRNLAVSGSGTKTFANEDLFLYGSLRILGGTAQFNAGTNGNMTIDSIITVASGATLNFQGTGTARSIIVSRSVVNNGTFAVNNSANLNHTLQVGRDFVNNGTLDFRNPNTNCNVTFSGANDATLSGTGLTTEFNRIIINKGADTSRVLQVTASNFSLAPTTPTGQKALELVNGTFRMSGTATTTITLNSDNEDFTIPATARLWMDNPNAQAVVTTAGNDRLILNGVLQVSDGQVTVGDVDDGGVNQMRILYEGTTPAIIVSGGQLNVAERIRQNSLTSTLRYNQSGGIVRVARFKSDVAGVNTTDEADFNMPIAGGTFTMSGGTLEVVRRNMGAAGTGGIAIRINASTTANVTGGTVHVLTANASGNSGTAISSGVPFYNLILGNGTASYDVGSPAATPQALRVLNDLTVNLGTTGQLRLYRVRTGGPTLNNINLTVGGNLNIQTGSLVFGTAATATTLTLDGAGAGTEQLISNTGSAPNITVRNFTISSGGKPVRLGTTSGADLVVQNNFTLTSGTLDAVTNGRSVTFSTATDINQNLAIPVTGITFYDLRINKTTVNNQVIVAGGNVTVTNTLDLQNGVLNLGANGLNLTNPTSGAITGGTFGVNRRILLGGAVSDLGVTRAYPSTATTGFVFPIGTGTLYTPATVNVTIAVGTGTITVKPINSRHPSAPATSLDYYWDVSVQGFGSGVQTAHTFGYVGVALSGAEANYRGNYFNGTTWAVVPQPMDDDVDETNDIFGAQVDAASVLNNVTGTFLNRAFTAGFGFANPVIFYSWAGGGVTMNWAPGTNNSATSPWSSHPTVFNSTGVVGLEPSPANPVIIQNGHTVTVTANGRTASSVTLNAGTTLDLVATTGHNFGAGVSGQGTLRTESASLPTLASSFRNTGGGTVDFAGATYNITGPQTFNNLTISAGTKTIVTGNLTINGNLSITGGTLNMATFSANRSSVGGALSLSAGAVLELQGAGNFPANYTTYSLAPTSTVRYNGNANQTISSLGGQPYGNLEVLITGTAATYTKTLAGATVVAGNLTVNRTGGTGNLILATNNHNLTIGGNFSLSQADPITQFNGGTSTVTFNGTGTQTITRVGGGTLTFNNLTVNKTSGTLTLATATAPTTLTVPGTLSLASGALTIGGSASVSNTLALNGTASGPGTITGSANSNLTIGGTANTSAGTLNFTSGGQILRDLTVNRGTTNAAEVTIGTDLSVQNTLTLTNGRVLMSGTNTLTCTNTTASPITGGNDNSFIDGRLAIVFPTTGVTRTFPIGAALFYRPVRVTTASATAGSTVRTEMINTSPNSGSLGGMNNISGVRYYKVDLTAGSLTSPQVRLEYQPDEVVTDPNDLVVARSENNSTWTNIGRDAANSSTSTPTGFITSNPTTIVNPTFFALGSLTTDNPLPVNMLSVNAVAKNGRTAVLEWETASEQDNLGFVLYRSETENGNFEQIASYQTTDKLRGQGSKLTETKYLYEDSRNTLPGKEYFYKLVSVDNNGTRHDITLGGQSVWSVQLPFEYALDQNYPNPFNPVTTIQFSLEKAGKTTLEIYNVLGQKVATLVNGELSAGAHRYQWNASGMASGIYFYRLRSDNFVATKKMLLVK
ncbi:MAG: T9SS type A sorting domain-containing protein [Chlorobiales bacterium]